MASCADKTLPWPSQLGHAQNLFPPPVFLDSEVSSELNSIVETGEPTVPNELQELAGHDDEYILHPTELYFQSTQRIHPVGDAYTQPTDPAAYHGVKHCLHLLESQGMISIRLLQSAILRGYHELRSAIYRAVFLNVGRCARLGQAIGIHDRRNATQLLRAQVSLPPSSYHYNFIIGRRGRHISRGFHICADLPGIRLARADSVSHL